MSWDNVEDAFKELDKKEYVPFAQGVWNYFEALQEKGFTRREAFRLIEGYAKFIYDMAFEEFAAGHVDEDEEEEQEDDVDPEEDDGVV